MFTAYQNDRNPNQIAAQSLTYDLDANPQFNEQPSCVGGESGVMETGVALFDVFDGFPITGPKVGDRNILTTTDLDECHGITSTVTLDGKAVTTYHYVMTQDFPYSVSCFRSTPVQAPGPE